MAEITIANSEFEDTYFQHTDSASTSSRVTSTQLLFGASLGFDGNPRIYNMLLQLDIVKRPRFIPLVGTSDVFDSELGYTQDSRY